MPEAKFFNIKKKAERWFSYLNHFNFYMCGDTLTAILLRSNRNEALFHVEFVVEQQKFHLKLSGYLISISQHPQVSFKTVDHFQFS
jgi:hypothetical protein